VEGDLLAVRILGEFFHRRLDQPDAAVVAVQLHVADEFVDRPKRVPALLAEDQFDVVPFVENDLGVIVLDDDGDGPAVVAVGRVANQSGSSKRTAAEYEHGNQ